MKTLPTALANHIDTRVTTLATAIKVTRRDSTVYGFTSHDIDDTVDGVLYSSKPGLLVTDIVIAASAAVGNLEMTTVHDDTVFTTADILNGVWRGAAFEIFRYNHASIGDGIDTLIAGNFGEFEIRQNTVVIELRDLRQYLQQPVGDASSKNCRARLGDARCTKSLVSFTHTGTITHITDNQNIRDSSRGEAADYFGDGIFTFTSGNNAGVSVKVKTYAADGSFSFALPFYGTVQVGDNYTAIAGCRKRLAEDCRDKFDNVLNFVGEPHRKGVNDLLKAPT